MEGEKMLDRLNNNNDNNIIIMKDDEHQLVEEGEVQLPGFRFHPTDEELVGFYLKRKVEKKPIFIDHLIKHIDIYKYDPWDLPKAGIGGEECYFFCKRGRKYKNSARPNRVTGSGFWKATGIDKPICSLLGCIGLKKSLVYYRGTASKGTKTGWMMHEFRLPADRKTTSNISIDAQMMIMISNNVQHEAEVWTLCRIFKRDVSYKRFAPDCRQKTRSAGKAASNLEYSKQRDNYRNNLSYEVLGAMGSSENIIKPAVNYDHQYYFYERNNLLSFASHEQLSLNTAQYPVVAAASHLTGDECFREGNWDELSPVIHFACP